MSWDRAGAPEPGTAPPTVPTTPATPASPASPDTIPGGGTPLA